MVMMMMMMMTMTMTMTMTMVMVMSRSRLRTVMNRMNALNHCCYGPADCQAREHRQPGIREPGRCGGNGGNSRLAAPSSCSRNQPHHRERLHGRHPAWRHELWRCKERRHAHVDRQHDGLLRRRVRSRHDGGLFRTHRSQIVSYLHRHALCYAMLCSAVEILFEIQTYQHRLHCPASPYILLVSTLCYCMK